MIDSKRKRKLGPGPWCGTTGGYTNHGCRCEACTDAFRKYHNDYMAAHPEQRDKAAERERIRRKKEPMTNKIPASDEAADLRVNIDPIVEVAARVGVEAWRQLQAERTRPKWAEAIRHFITDEVLDEKYGYPLDGKDDWIHDEIEDAVNEIFCNAYGHHIVDDQCMIPEHRFCVYCNRRASDL